MRVEIKFCGLTRAADAALGAALGAGYLGVIFTDSPRRVDADGALGVFRPIRTLAEGRPKQVGVFGREKLSTIARTAERVGLDIVQLHGDAAPDDVRALRTNFPGEIWAARRISGRALPDDIVAVAAAADRLLLDTRPPDGHTLGGSGKPFDWEGVAAELAGVCRKRPIVVAGGLNPENVGKAIAIFSPGIVDVSSGVERSPGIKDEGLMTAFVRAVGAAAR